MPPELRVAIVGCGRMGKERARCVSAAGGNVAAVFDVDQERSRELSNRYQARSLRCVDECFELDLDALFVCTAPGTRGPLEAQCIRAGLSLFVEKPVGTSVDQCAELITLLRQKPVINQVGYMNRYRHSVQLAKDILDPVSIIGFSAHWVCKRYNVPWWEIEQASGGPHNEQATHLFDLCRFLVGDVLHVKSIFTGTSRVASSLECCGGVPGTMFYSCDGNEKAIGLEIFTDRGSIALSGWDFSLTGNSIDGRLHGEDEDIFLIETSTFFDAQCQNRQDLVKSDFVDAIKTQAVMDAVRQSGQEERAVEVRRRDWNLVYGD